MLGVYAGPGAEGVAATDQFAEWLGRPVHWATDFVDFRHGWEQVANPEWLLEPWGRWVASAPGRRLVLSVPLLTDEARGELREGAAGEFDEHFRELANRLVEHGLGHSVIRLGWEANGDWMPWRAGADPAAWRAYFRRVTAAMSSVAGAHFEFDWTINAGERETEPESFYPGDDVVDIIGLDVYDVDPSGQRDRWAHTRDQPYGLAWHLAFAAQRGKPVSFPEWGLWSAGTPDGGSGDNAEFIEHMADWIARAPCVRYHAYFNTAVGATGAVHALDAYPSARTAFMMAFRTGGARSCASTTSE